MRYARRMQTLSLNTLADLDNAHYGLAAHCWRCERWHDFDIAEFVTKHGNRSILDFMPRCLVCGERATKQVTPPLTKFDGYPK
jgi:hypothetical protein